MRTLTNLKKLTIPAVVGALAIAGAACEVEDEPDVVEQTIEDDGAITDDGADTGGTDTGGTDDTGGTTGTETEGDS